MKKRVLRRKLGKFMLESGLQNKLLMIVLLKSEVKISFNIYRPILDIFLRRDFS